MWIQVKSSQVLFHFTIMEIQRLIKNNGTTGIKITETKRHIMKGVGAIKSFQR